MHANTSGFSSMNSSFCKSSSSKARQELDVDFNTPGPCRKAEKRSARSDGEQGRRSVVTDSKEWLEPRTAFHALAVPPFSAGKGTQAFQSRPMPTMFFETMAWSKTVQRVSLRTEIFLPGSPTTYESGAWSDWRICITMSFRWSTRAWPRSTTAAHGRSSMTRSEPRKTSFSSSPTRTTAFLVLKSTETTLPRSHASGLSPGGSGSPPSAKSISSPAASVWTRSCVSKL
mmetsp:Transcript_3599/g.12474  ORF Transcript_3599/g.12474 Transcript_3599/m.12474 type:complete len:229 (+) Transcript_3599:1502-2188(+)